MSLNLGRAPVSVVIPCLGCHRPLKRALASVAIQTWLPAEIILVDDSNPPEDRAALMECIESSDVKNILCVRTPRNLGPGGARNFGWELASQPYLAFLDADDSWHPMKIAIQLEYMIEHSEVDFTAHHWSVFDPAFSGCKELTFAGQGLRTRRLRPIDLLWRNPVCTSTVMLKRALHQRFPERRYAEDYELWLRLLLGGCRGVFLDAYLAYLHKPPYGAGGLSGELWRMEVGEIQTYWSLCREGMLPPLNLSFLIPFSLAKFVRRWTLVTLRRWTK